MPKKTVRIMPSTTKVLEQMGEQIKLARRRRNIPASLAAQRARISRSTLWKIENGDPTVSIGMYAAALHALNGLDKDLLLVAKDDVLGRKLQDITLLKSRK